MGTGASRPALKVMAAFNRVGESSTEATTEDSGSDPDNANVCSHSETLRLSDCKAFSFGLLITLGLSATMVVAGLKSGVVPGVSPLVILFAWGIFATQGVKGCRALNVAQVTGGSSFAAVSGVIYPAPLLQHIFLNRAQAGLAAQGVKGDLRAMPWNEAKDLMEAHGYSVPGVNVPVLIVTSLAGALIGWGMMGAGTRRFLSDETLPAPEARACQKMIQTAITEKAQRPRLLVSLVLGAASSFMAPLLVHVGLAQETVVLWSQAVNGRTFAVELPFLPIYIGVGGLLRLGTALLVFAGSLVRLVGDFVVASADPSGPFGRAFPESSTRWIGGAAMTVAVLYAMVNFLGPWLLRKLQLLTPKGRSDEMDKLLSFGRPVWLQLGAAVVLGTSLITAWLFATAGFSGFTVTILLTIIIMASIMVTLGAILSLQIGSSASPVSGTIFVTILVLSLVCLAFNKRSLEGIPTLLGLAVGACVAVCTANDSSQDYKAVQLCGLPPRHYFLAHLLGLLLGCVVVPLSLFVAHEAYGLGTDRLPAPQGQMFASLLEGLLLQGNVPWWPALVGLVIGALAVLADAAASRRGVQLPAMALAVGIYLPATLGIGLLFGATARLFGERVRHHREGHSGETHEGILAAAGLLTGASILDLLLGVAVLASFDMQNLELFSSSGESHKVPLNRWVQNAISLVGIGFLGFILSWNSLTGTLEQSDGPSEPGCQEVELPSIPVAYGLPLHALVNKAESPQHLHNEDAAP